MKILDIEGQRNMRSTWDEVRRHVQRNKVGTWAALRASDERTLRRARGYMETEGGNHTAWQWDGPDLQRGGYVLWFRRISQVQAVAHVDEDGDVYGGVPHFYDDPFAVHGLTYAVFNHNAGVKESS